MADKFINLNNGITAIKTWVMGLLATKQDTLVSGTNIKTVNNTSLLGSGNIDIQGGSSNVFVVTYLTTSYAAIAAAIQSNKELILKNPNESGDYIYYPFKTNIEAGVIYIYFVRGTDTPTATQMTIRRWSINFGGGWENAIISAYTKSGVDELLADKQDVLSIATDDIAGIIKTNSAESISVNADGQLTVGGRLGQFPTTTGIFAPNNRDPRNVNNYSFLITDAMGMDMTANRSMAVVSGLGLTCRSAAAGSTEYRISNTYANRIQAILCAGGYAARDEATSTQQRIIPIVSVTINGSSYIPDSSPNPSGTASDIIIKTSETLNPDSAITNIRLFGKMGSYATLHAGNGIASEGGGRNLLLGGGVTKAGSSNDNCLVGNGIFSNGNGNACFGRYHIARKNRGLLAGTGHDTTNAPSEGASAVGQYSYMDSNTLFAVGNGSSHTDRKNAFEVRSDGIVLRSPNGTRFKLSVDDSGNLSTTQL